MTPFDQRDAACRCEWGLVGLDAIAPADVMIIVDVFSFSTCVDVAVSRGAEILPYRWKDGTAEVFAREQNALLARGRDDGGYSLSAASFLAAPAGLRCVLPSPNGAMLSMHAAMLGSVVLTGCLRNATAVARAAQRLGNTFNVCPAGERWPDGSLRPSLEDWLGAGAILSCLPGTRSPETAAAITSFESRRDSLMDALSAASSGRELLARGSGADVALAAAYDVSDHVPRLFDGAYRDHTAGA